MKPFARVLVFVFAIVVVVGILLAWKKQQRADALERLKTDFAADISEFEDEFFVGCSHERLTDLVELAELLNRVGKPTTLDLTGAPNLVSLQGAGSLLTIDTLIAIDCPKLVSAEGVGFHPKLADLVFTESTALEDVSAIEGLPELKTLDLSGCSQVAALDISTLPSIENLYLSRCRKLTALDLSSATGLQQLYLDGCAGLKEIVGLDGLSQLTDLDVSNATGLIHLSGVEKLSSLVVLDIRNVDLTDFSGIGALPTLRVLRMGGQDAIETLEPFSEMESLNEIHLEACPNLYSLKGIPPSINQYAGFTHCPKLESLAGIEVAGGIEQLDLSGCENLHDVTAVAELRSLLQLSFVKCRQVTEIDFVENLPKLVIVALGGSGVVPASVEELKPANKELFFDFELAD
ncbi:MAG: leucine-rich repeat protein [Verrucomicrobiales bacterium]|jgi:hypothetical protein|nr:leucine-rich repeat protein [Verrucomicrobiales bacterium]